MSATEFSAMSDDQLQQSIKDLYNRAVQPAPSRTPATTRTRYSATPQPSSTPFLRLAPPGYQPVYNPYSQITTTTQHIVPATVPPSTTTQIQQNPTAISASAQGYRTSYASRLRTGSTLLVQPTIFPGSSSEHNTTTTTTSSFQPILTPATSFAQPTRASSRRSRPTINYAELDDEDEDEDDEKDKDHTPDAGALDNDVTDGDFVGSRAARAAGRPSSRNVNFQSQSGPADNASAGLDQSYLGQVPPAHFIKSYPIQSTAASAAVPGPMLGLSYGTNYPSGSEKSPPAPSPLLIPVRVEFDVPDSGLRIRDVFLWNIHESSPSQAQSRIPQITPEVFAHQFCKDLEIPTTPWAEMVANQIRAQVEDARGEAWVSWMESWMGEIGKLEEEAWGKNEDELYDEEKEDEGQDIITANAEGEMNVDSATPSFIPECRVLLSIDVQIATFHLTDHIEWDLLSPLTPEQFSVQLCRDLGLSGEAVPLIACAVHEELCRHRKDVVEWGVVSAIGAAGGGSGTAESGAAGIVDRTGLGFGNLGRPSRERDGRYPKPLQSAWRDWAEAEEYATRWEELSPEEVERREIERERAGRRLRRETSKWRRR
ncbi:hypothetical protein GYMLUDRAFT_576087 [Collybiopsis luxurians FD-317 M1]|uniref:SNF5-domain-containing protein n=1 Tax=Collybiopsis luxurians FD-317 M1 TaxID=944289 RepID=A0A0D0C0P4_9AGAR|nr:hypothetical protein GYMLUDRAFT_576087 [Collybiopsis luxurians FD-317 M1]